MTRTEKQASLRYPPGWVDVVNHLGYVLVIYGVRIGVYSPKGTPYNDADRRRELDSSRAAGAVAWGLVLWSSGLG